MDTPQPGRSRRPQLVDNWRAVLLRAWSVRLDALGIALSAAEFGLGALMSAPPISRGAFTAIGMAVTAASLTVRLIKQHDLSGDGR